MSIAGQIRGYLDRVENIDYLKNILNEVPLPDLFQSLRQLIQSPSADDVGRADLFIRDAIYRAKSNNSRFMEQFFAAGIPAAYAQNVFRQNWGIRATAISALATFSDWWSAEQIQGALKFLESSDPTLLPRLVKPIMFQTHWKDWSLPKRLIGNSDFLVRWSTLEIFEHCARFPLPDRKILDEVNFCLSTLREDGNALVKSEAGFLSDTIAFYEIMPTLEKSEKRQRSKALNRIPRIRFDMFWFFVGNELSARRKEDFTMAELHEFAKNFQKAN